MKKKHFAILFAIFTLFASTNYDILHAMNPNNFDRELPQKHARGFRLGDGQDKWARMSSSDEKECFVNPDNEDSGDEVLSSLECAVEHLVVGAPRVEQELPEGFLQNFWRLNVDARNRMLQRGSQQ